MGACPLEELDSRRHFVESGMDIIGLEIGNKKGVNRAEQNLGSD